MQRPESDLRSLARHRAEEVFSHVEVDGKHRKTQFTSIVASAFMERLNGKA